MECGQTGADEAEIPRDVSGVYRLETHTRLSSACADGTFATDIRAGSMERGEAGPRQAATSRPEAHDAARQVVRRRLVVGCSVGWVEFTLGRAAVGG
jgi:hypothetical protein